MQVAAGLRVFAPPPGCPVLLPPLQLACWSCAAENQRQLELARKQLAAERAGHAATRELMELVQQQGGGGSIGSSARRVSLPFL